MQLWKEFNKKHEVRIIWCHILELCFVCVCEFTVWVGGWVGGPVDNFPLHVDFCTSGAAVQI